MARDNRTVGKFHLDGIAPAPRGIPQIEVSFDIDADGILHVSAKDKSTGKEQKIRIEASSGLTEEEIKRMKEEAEANAEADKKERDEIEKLNKAEATIFSAEKQLSELKDKLPAETRTSIETNLAELKQAHGAKDLAGIDAAIGKIDRLMIDMMGVMAAQQAQQQSQGAPNQQEGDSPQQEEPTEAEYEEVE